MVRNCSFIIVRRPKYHPLSLKKGEGRRIFFSWYYNGFLCFSYTVLPICHPLQWNARRHKSICKNLDSAVKSGRRFWAIHYSANLLEKYFFSPTPLPPIIFELKERTGKMRPTHAPPLCSWLDVLNSKHKCDSVQMLPQISSEALSSFVTRGWRNAIPICSGLEVRLCLVENINSYSHRSS